MSREKKPKKLRRRNQSTDGFIPNDTFKGKGTIDFNRSSEDSNISSGAVDDFKRPEGFNPSAQTVIDMSLEDDGLKSKKRTRGELRLYKKSKIPGVNKFKKWRQGKKPWSRRRKIITWLSLIIVLIGAFLAIKTYLNVNKIFSGGNQTLNLCEDINRLNKEGDCRINILVLGIGGPGHDGGDLTDTILLASIDPINNKIDLLSIPRDLWVEIPGYGYHKINEAYYHGKTNSQKKSSQERKRDGLKKLDETLKPVLDVPINFHILVDFTAFKQAVDAVGGITVNVPEQLYDPTIAWENEYNSVIANKGLQKFNGSKALLYAKSRETSTDFARGERQRLITVALKEKILSLGTFSNPIKISNLLASLGNNVFTDFSLHDTGKLYDIVSKVPSKDIKSLDMVTAPHDLLTTANLDGLSIVQPKAGLFMYAAIRTFVHTALRDGRLAQENAPIAVFNATDVEGLAANKASELKSYGYKVVKVGNATSGGKPDSTIVVDLTGNNKFTKHYLENRFKTKTVSKIPSEYNLSPPEGTAFVIILGKNDTPNI